MKWIFVKTITISAVMLLSVSLVDAQNHPATQGKVVPDDEKFEFAATYFLGLAHTLPSTVTISQPSLNTQLEFENVQFQGRSFNKPLYYGIRTSFFQHRKSVIGAEAEFIHLKVYAETENRVQVSGTNQGVPIARDIRLGDIVGHYSISHGVNLLLFNIVGRHSIERSAAHPRGRLILTARGGIGATIPHTESEINGQAQEQYEWGRLAWQLTGGAEFHLGRGWYGLGEYKFTRTRQQGKVFSGTAESLLRSHHAVFGISYHF